MVSFDVKSLSTNVPLDRTIDINYDHKELETPITKSEMKEMLILCTKNVHFRYNRKIFVQTDGVTMGSLLGTVLADIILTVLEKTLLPDIYIHYIKFWRRYVDAFPPFSWKRGTLRTLVQRAYLVCSAKTNLKKEITHLEKVFIEKNNYPKYVTKQVFTQIKEEHKNRNYNNNMKNSIKVPIKFENKNEKQHLLPILYQGEKGDYLIKSMKRNLKKILPNNVKPQITYTGRKLGSLFQTTDQTIFEHKHDVICHGKWPAENCVDYYIGEIARRVNERIVDHTGRHTNSHLQKHSIETGHKLLEAVDYKIVGTGYRNNIMKRKLSETLFIKELKPTLNKPEKSLPLKLFN